MNWETSKNQNHSLIQPAVLTS